MHFGYHLMVNKLGVIKKNKSRCPANQKEVRCFRNPCPEDSSAICMVDVIFHGKNLIVNQHDVNKNLYVFTKNYSILKIKQYEKIFKKKVI